MKQLFILLSIVCIAACGNKNTQRQYQDEGVLINGVNWATRNVDLPGTFAAAPESAGMFYQFNSKVGWSSVNPVVNSNGGTKWGDLSTTDDMMWGEEWFAANDPSPDGWRVPTSEELENLLDTLKVTQEWTLRNSTYGITFTDKATGNSIFLPANGARNNDDGVLFGLGDFGGYWSSVPASYNIDYADVLQFFAEWTSDAVFAKQFDYDNPSCTGNKRDMGFSVRCVMKEKTDE